MNPLLVDALGSILRWLLALVAGHLVQRGIWTQADAATYVAAASVALLSLGWSLWSKYRSRLKLLTALASPVRTCEHALEQHIKSGACLPSTSTPKSSIPAV